jgi:hypothetical protein
MGTLDRKKVRLNDQYFTPETDSFFVRGRVLAKDSPRPYFTGWISRHKPGTVYGVRRFMDRHSARLSFEQACESQQLSRYPSLTKDWQQSRVYDWEGKFVYPHGKTIGRKQLHKLIERVCDDYRLEKPQVVWEKHTDNSWVFPGENELHFGHRDNIGALHEMAHLFTNRAARAMKRRPTTAPALSGRRSSFTRVTQTWICIIL